MAVTRRFVLASGAALGIGLALPAHANTQAFGGRAFGSTWRFVGGRDVDEAAIRPLIDAIIARVDGQMSPWRADSDLSRFNRDQCTDWYSMPQEVCHLARTSLDIAQTTDGAFDPTVGPAVARFGFGPIAGGSGSYHAIDVGDGVIRKNDAELTLDLCGIAKGHALDAIAQALRADGINHGLIELGGEIAAIGDHPTGRAWQVALERPGTPHMTAHRIVTPEPFALATSGHLPNGYQGHIATSHLIDPHRQRPADQSLASVSVLASTGAEADALATALTVLGPERGVALAERLAIAALFLERTAAGLREIMTGRFADHVVA